MNPSCSSDFNFVVSSFLSTISKLCVTNMVKFNKRTSISAKSAAVFFFVLWIVTLLGFSYSNYLTHYHYQFKSHLRTTKAKSFTSYTSYQLNDNVYATSPEQAEIATTKFVVPTGHCAPFWTKDSLEMKTLSSKTLFETKMTRFEIHKVRLESGKVIDDWGWFEEPDQVNVAVQLSSGKMLLFRQSKYGLKDTSLAPVGGMIENGETPLQAAKRETREELHVNCIQWTFLGRMRIATNRGGGFCNSFVAQGCDRIEEDQNNPFDYEKQQEVVLEMDEFRIALKRSKVHEIKWVATFLLAMNKMDEDGLEDNVLPASIYKSTLQQLRSFDFPIEGSFPGRINHVDPSILPYFLNALDQLNYTNNFTEKNVRGFTSLLCSDGFIHHDFLEESTSNETKFAAVFYFGFPSFKHHDITIQRSTGTAFYREKETGLERINGINQLLFCQDHPYSIICASEVPPQKQTEDTDLFSILNIGKNYNYNNWFEEIYKIEGIPNRLIVYPQDVFHNAWYEKIDYEKKLPCSSDKGRLAISLFFYSPRGGLEIKKLEL